MGDGEEAGEAGESIDACPVGCTRREAVGCTRREAAVQQGNVQQQFR